MPYGRDDMGKYYNAFYDAMQEKDIDLEVIMPFANQTLCHYLIFRDDKEILGNPQDFGLEFFERIDGYVIYRNSNIPLEY